MLGGVSCGDVVTICGLFAVQCIFGLYMMFLDHLLAAGVPSLFIIVVACAASSVVVLPFAIALERKKWPKQWSPVLVVQLVIISLGGVSIYQVFMMLGVERTSPAIASAMPNLGPGLIFLISACLRLERFEWKCKYTRAKILGTLVCLSGAMCLSFLKNPAPTVSPKSSVPSEDSVGNKDWILGCIYLLTGVTVFACNTILQAATLKKFPAPLSICVIAAMMGSIFSAIIQVIMEGKLNSGTADNMAMIIGEIVLVGGVVIGLCTTFQVSNIPQADHPAGHPAGQARRHRRGVLAAEEADDRGDTPHRRRLPQGREERHRSRYGELLVCSQQLIDTHIRSARRLRRRGDPRRAPHRAVPQGQRQRPRRPLPLRAGGGGRRGLSPFADYMDCHDSDPHVAAELGARGVLYCHMIEPRMALVDGRRQTPHRLRPYREAFGGIPGEV